MTYFNVAGASNITAITCVIKQWQKWGSQLHGAIWEGIELKIYTPKLTAVRMVRVDC